MDAGENQGQGDCKAALDRLAFDGRSGCGVASVPEDLTATLNAEDAVDAGENQGQGDRKAALDRLASAVVEQAMVVHSALGPGLLESVYEACLAHELAKIGLPMRRQVALPIHYDGTTLDTGFRVDLLVADHLVVEVKAVEKLLPIHSAQLLTYLKLGGFRLGLLLNFNVVHMRDGLKRVANGL